MPEKWFLKRANFGRYYILKLFIFRWENDESKCMWHSEGLGYHIHLYKLLINQAMPKDKDTGSSDKT